MDKGERLFNEGKKLYEKGRIWEAIPKLKEAIKIHPNYADYHNFLGLCYYSLGLFKDAIRSYERALQINPDYIEANINMAIVLNDIGEFEKSSKYYEKAVLLEKGSGGIPQTIRNNLANTYKKLGETYLEIGEYEKAEEEFKKALQIAPGFLDIKTLLANCLIQKKEYKEAEKILKEVLNSNPKYKMAFTL
ncbi:MAG: tetratricopeptide repeat protein, partial [candidate division WOR-3 bacterium]